jgi:hypothetical protein
MKRILLGLLLLCFWIMGKGQTFAEWFSQNATRLKYYGQQVSALQAYLLQVEKGYQVVESGLGTIRNVKSGEYNLHNAFYTALGQVNPAVGRMAEISEIALLQAAIIRRFNAALTRYRQFPRIGGDVVANMETVYARVLSAGLQDINTLVGLLTVNTLQLSDDQRAERIVSLDRAMKDRYAFTLAFTDEAELLVHGRRADARGLGAVSRLYGIP